MTDKKKWDYYGVEYNPGDRVKVVRWEKSYADHGMGHGVPWVNVWLPREQDGDMAMDEALGMEFEIAEISAAGVVFTEFVDEGYEAERRAAMYAYPLSALEKVTPTLH